MRRIGRTSGMIGMILVASVSAISRSDDTPKLDDSKAAIDRVLTDWHRQRSTTKTVRVRYRSSWKSKGRDEILKEGIAILASPSLALLEISSVDNEGRSTSLEERMIWDGRTILHFEMDGHRATRCSLPKEWQAPPSLLRIPFFFEMTIEEAKRDYVWEILRNDPERIALKITPRRKPHRWSSFSTCTVELDRKTFLPTRMASTDPDEGTSRTFEPLEIKLNAKLDLDGLRSPSLDTWRVLQLDSWLVRWLLR